MSKTSSRTYSKSVKPVVKRIILAWKWDSLKESQNFGKVGFVKKESFNDKFNKKSIKYPMHYNIPA